MENTKQEGLYFLRVENITFPPISYLGKMINSVIKKKKKPKPKPKTFFRMKMSLK